MYTDLRLAFRQIARYPAFAAAAILAFAIGLAVNVDIQPDRYKSLGLSSGDTVFLFPKVEVQGPDYTI